MKATIKKTPLLMLALFIFAAVLSFTVPAGNVSAITAAQCPSLSKTTTSLKYFATSAGTVNKSLSMETYAVNANLTDWCVAVSAPYGGVYDIKQRLPYTCSRSSTSSSWSCTAGTAKSLDAWFDTVACTTTSNLRGIKYKYTITNRTTGTKYYATTSVLYKRNI